MELPSNKPEINPAPPCILVIFGAGGDLTRRKLMPALYHLRQNGFVQEHFAVLGVDRMDTDNEGFRQHLSRDAQTLVNDQFDAKAWEHFVGHVEYMSGDFTDAATYKALEARLEEIRGARELPGNFLFYLSTPPRFFGEIAIQLGEAGLSWETEGAWRRIIIEKPFGHDLESARALNATLHHAFAEHQIYRIDHYMGKETVQNILAYRFANATVEPIWNRNYIDHVQITVAEDLGVGTRAGYYETAGALRDMIPNHLLAVLAVIGAEPSNSLDAELVRDEQAKVLRAIQDIPPEDVLTHAVRGQYGPGTMPDGTQVPGYREEPGVDPNSTTETFVALKLKVDTWRWAGVPFYMRTGKRLPKRYTEVVIQYQHAPNVLFQADRVHSLNVLPANKLILRIQPDEGIGFSFNAKVPGPSTRFDTVKMNFAYSEHFQCGPIGSGYETLIYDCMQGDATLFKRADIIELGWQIVEPILDVWKALPPRTFPNYAAGTMGPEAADELLARDGRTWNKPPRNL